MRRPEVAKAVRVDLGKMFPQSLLDDLVDPALGQVETQPPTRPEVLEQVEGLRLVAEARRENHHLVGLPLLPLSLPSPLRHGHLDEQSLLPDPFRLIVNEAPIQIPPVWMGGAVTLLVGRDLRYHLRDPSRCEVDALDQRPVPSVGDGVNGLPEGAVVRRPH